MAVRKVNGKRTTEYSAWLSLRERCDNPNVHNYDNYGGRGIKYCKRWDSYDLFFKDMGFKPSSSHSLDRIDNERNYGPNNCRWATLKEQANNKRNTVLLTYKRETLNTEQWAIRFGLTREAIKLRIKYGWTVSETLETPLLKTKTYKYKGKSLPLSEWAKLRNMNKYTFRKRVNILGWSIQKALETPIGPQNGR